MARTWGAGPRVGTGRAAPWPTRSHVKRANSEQGELNGRRIAERENEKGIATVGARALAPESPLKYAFTLTSTDQTHSTHNDSQARQHQGYRPPFASLRDDSQQSRRDGGGFNTFAAIAGTGRARRECVKRCGR